MYKVVTYTRSDLFEKVWTTPLLQLAKEIGVSDVALGKACRRADIPLPGRGYWAKEARLRDKPSLPSSAFQGSVKFQVLDNSLPAQKAKEPTKGKGLAVKVPRKLTDPHPLVEQTLRWAEKGDTKCGIVVFGTMQALNVRVSPAAIDRALRLLDVLMKASEARGDAWATGVDGKTTVACDGEVLAVELTEKITTINLPLQPIPLNPPPDYWRTRPPRYDWKPTKELTFHISTYLPLGMHRNWRDTKHSTLDDKLADILIGLRRAAAGLKVEREKREIREREAAEKARIKRQPAEAKEALRLAREQLVASMELWEQASRIRRYCEVVEHRTASLAAEETSAITNWLGWAREQADLLDPIKRGLPKIKPWEVAVPEVFKGLHSWETPDPDWWTDVS